MKFANPYMLFITPTEITNARQKAFADLNNKTIKTKQGATKKFILPHLNKKLTLLKKAAEKAEQMSLNNAAIAPPQNSFSFLKFVNEIKLFLYPTLVLYSAFVASHSCTEVPMATTASQNQGMLKQKLLHHAG